MQALVVGLTDSIPFLELEYDVESKLAAATADDAEADRSQWSFAGETSRQAQTRKVLRHLAAKWGRHYQDKLAQAWFWDHEDNVAN